MLNEHIENFIDTLNFSYNSPTEMDLETTVSQDKVDLSNPPEGVVAGSNVVQMSTVSDASVRSAITLSIAAAQLYADTSQDVTSPDIWAAKYIHALAGLGWTNMSYNYTDSEFKKIDAEVHEEIIPILSAALGPAAVRAASVIISALEGLKKLDDNSPWIKLYGKESAKVSATEFQFSLADTVDGIANLKTVGIRLDAKKKVNQILFFRLKSEKANLKTVNFGSSQSVSMLQTLNEKLRPKIEDSVSDFIAALPKRE